MAVGNEKSMEVIHMIPAAWFVSEITQWMLMLVLYRFVGFACDSLLIRNYRTCWHKVVLQVELIPE